MKHKIYLAASWSQQRDMIARALDLVNLGHGVTSRWILNAENEQSKHDCADRDLEDINSCDTFILFTDNEASSRGGKYVELGYAIAKNKQCFIVGQTTNIFTHHLSCKRRDRFSDVVDTLK